VFWFDAVLKTPPANEMRPQPGGELTTAGHRRAYYACLLLAVLVRCAFVAFSDARSLYSRWSTVTDAALYDKLGWNLVTEGTYGVGSRPSAFSLPAYPLVLATVYRVVGHLPGAVRWVQVLLGLGTVVLLGRLARSLGGRRSEMLAVALAAAYPYFIYFTGEILTETLFIFALSGALLSAARLGSQGRVRDGALHGMFASLLVMTRPMGLFLEMGALFLARPWAREGRRRRLIGLLVAAIFVAVPWSGWIVRNHRAFGETLLLDTHGGYALYMGQLLARDLDEKEVYARLGYSRLSIEKGILPGGARGEVLADRRCGREALAMIRADPAAFVTAFRRNVTNLWFGLNMVQVAAKGGGLLPLTLVGWLSYSPILLLGLAGLLRLGWQHRWVALAAVLTSFLLSSMLHGLVLGGMRYRVATLDPFLLVLASWEATTLITWFRSRRGSSRRLVVPGVDGSPESG
jgi:4-amino-4-deoxy-L-arabinose transferase-like glycosyltransferase